MKKIFFLIVVFNFIFFVGCERNSNPTTSLNTTNNTTALNKSYSPKSVLDVQTYNYIPLVLVLFQNDSYGGTRRIFIEESNDL